MTKDTLVILPRLAEGGKVLGDDGSSLGGLSLNGTVLAGTALAKNELEWHALHKDPKGFESLLRSIGIPSDEAERGCIY
jgi:sulfate adenylyltransferase (ADP) / ATP adenylyltransferase